MPIPIRWEYIILDVGVQSFWTGAALNGDALTQKLNELGADGWEAVSLAGMTGYQTSTRDIIVVLKRPAVEAPGPRRLG